MSDEIVEPIEVEEPEPFQLPEDFATQVQSWGVPLESIPEAVETFKRLQTEEGVIDTFIATGQNLGFGIKELQRLFEEDAPVTPAAPAPVAAPIEQEDPDRLLTAAEVKDMIAREVVAPFEQREQQRAAQEFQQRQANLFTAVDSWFDSKEIKDPETRTFIAQLADKSILPGQDSYDPRVTIPALERAAAQYDAFIEKQAAAYISKKAATAAGLPTPVGGHTGGGDADEAPDYSTLGRNALSTARERVRARLRESGELGG